MQCLLTEAEATATRPMFCSSTDTGRSRATQAMPRAVARVNGTGNHRRPPRMYPFHAAAGVAAIALCKHVLRLCQRSPQCADDMRLQVSYQSITSIEHKLSNVTSHPAEHVTLGSSFSDAKCMTCSTLVRVLFGSSMRPTHNSAEKMPSVPHLPVGLVSPDVAE